MGIDPTEAAQAEQQQWLAAQDAAPQIRLVAGPGTGKSATIERRVAHLLNSGADPQRLYVISFTRATCGELTARIAAAGAANSSRGGRVDDALPDRSICSRRLGTFTMWSWRIR